MNDEQLLAAVDELIRLMPDGDTVFDGSDASISWQGRCQAVLDNWNSVAAVDFASAAREARRPGYTTLRELRQKMLLVLHTARHDLMLRLGGAPSVAVAHGGFHDYFDGLRKIIERAKAELLFVDPYLDADFVGRYLVHVGTGVTVRLLGRERIKTLVPAVEAFRKQHGLAVEVRSASNFHDRYVFVDHDECYQSGASFKDGARNAPTAINQILDLAAQNYATYDAIWKGGTVEL